MTVYSLTASDEPLQVRYVGAATNSLEKRLRGHWHEEKRRFGRKDHRKSDWMREVVERGAAVEIHPLSHHKTLGELRVAEQKWISFWREYCDLLNLQFRPHYFSKVTSLAIFDHYAQG